MVPCLKVDCGLISSRVDSWFVKGDGSCDFLSGVVLSAGWT